MSPLYIFLIANCYAIYFLRASSACSLFYLEIALCFRYLILLELGAAQFFQIPSDFFGYFGMCKSVKVKLKINYKLHEVSPLINDDK